MSGIEAADVLPVSPDVVGDALGRELELLGDGAQDAAVGLVVDEEVDVVERRRRARASDLLRRLDEDLDGLVEGRVAVHVEQPLVVVGGDRVAHPAVGLEQDRADLARRRRGRARRRAAPSPNSVGGALVLGVDDAREDLGADDEHAARRGRSRPARRPRESADSQPVQAAPTS